MARRCTHHEVIVFVDAFAVSPQQVAVFVKVDAALLSCEDHLQPLKSPQRPAPTRPTGQTNTLICKNVCARKTQFIQGVHGSVWSERACRVNTCACAKTVHMRVHKYWRAPVSRSGKPKCKERRWPCCYGNLCWSSHLSACVHVSVVVCECVYLCVYPWLCILGTQPNTRQRWELKK